MAGSWCPVSSIRARMLTLKLGTTLALDPLGKSNILGFQVRVRRLGIHAQLDTRTGSPLSLGAS